MFRIENRRAYAVTGPSLLTVAAPNFNPKVWQWNAGYFEMKWLNSQQFTLHDQRWFSREQPNPGAQLDRFWQTEKLDFGSDGSSKFIAQFSADAVCSLTPGDKYKVEDIKPGEFQKD